MQFSVLYFLIAPAVCVLAFLLGAHASISFARTHRGALAGGAPVRPHPPATRLATVRLVVRSALAAPCRRNVGVWMACTVWPLGVGWGFAVRFVAGGWMTELVPGFSTPSLLFICIMFGATVALAFVMFVYGVTVDAVDLPEPPAFGYDRWRTAAEETSLRDPQHVDH